MFTKWVRQIKDKVLFSSKKAPTFSFNSYTFSAKRRTLSLRKEQLWTERTARFKYVWGLLFQWHTMTKLGNRLLLVLTQVINIAFPLQIECNVLKIATFSQFYAMKKVLICQKCLPILSREITTRYKKYVCTVQCGIFFNCEIFSSKMKYNMRSNSDNIMAVRVL